MPQPISMIDDIGVPRTVDAGDVDTYLAAGWQVESPEAQQSRILEERANTLEGTAAGLVEATGRGVYDPLAGVANLAASKLGATEAVAPSFDELMARGIEATEGPGRGAAYMEQAKANRAHLGAAGTVAEIGGSLLNPLARVAGAGVGAAMRGVAPATGAFSRALQAGVRYGAPGSAEGAIFGAGSAMTEAALAGETKDFDKLGEKLYAGFKGGATDGMIGGSLLGAAGSLAASGARKVGGSGFLRTMSDELTLKALDPSKRSSSKLTNSAGGRATVAKQLRETGIVTTGGVNAELAVRVEQEAGEAIGKALRRAEDAGVAVRTDKVLAAIDGMAAKRTGSMARSVERGGEQLLDEVSKFRAVSEAAGGKMTPTQVHAFRADLDKSIKWHISQGTQLQDDLRKVRGSLEDSIETAIKQSGRDNIAAYKGAKERFRAARWANENIADNAARGQTNRSVGLLDTVAGAGGLAAGLATGGVGTGALYGLAVAGASKLARAKAPSVVGVTLDRLLTSNKRTTNSVRAFLQAPRKVIISEESRRGQESRSSAERAFKPKAGESLNDAYARRIREVQEASPEKIRGLDQAATEAPNTTAAVVATATRARAYLIGEAPTDRQGSDPLQPHLTKPQPNRADLERYARKWEAVDDPVGTVERRLADGTLTREHVEAIKAVYPVTYQEIRQKVFEELADSKERVPYDKRVRLGILFDFPADKSLRPDQIARTQALYAVTLPNEQAAQGPAQPAQAPLQLAQSHATPAQAIEGGMNQF